MFPDVRNSYRIYWACELVFLCYLYFKTCTWGRPWLPHELSAPPLHSALDACPRSTQPPPSACSENAKIWKIIPAADFNLAHLDSHGRLFHLCGNLLHRRWVVACIVAIADVVAVANIVAPVVIIFLGRHHVRHYRLRVELLSLAMVAVPIFQSSIVKF